jgi:hypothetical protein
MAVAYVAYVLGGVRTPFARDAGTLSNYLMPI